MQPARREALFVVLATVMPLAILWIFTPPLLTRTGGYPRADGDVVLTGIDATLAITAARGHTSAANAGFPFGYRGDEFYDVTPLAWMLFAAFGAVCSDWIDVIRLYFVAGFVLTSLSTHIALRSIRLTPIVALCCALLFTFVPYHLMRYGHLTLSNYYNVPICYLMVRWIAGLGRQAAVDESHPTRAARWLPALQSVVAASNGIYYAFYACLFAGVTGVVFALRDRTLAPLIRAIGALATMSVTVTVFMLPMASVHVREGQNHLIWRRSFEQTETYGLKMVQMLLPSPHHRLPALASLAHKYCERATNVNENQSASLGVILSVGFVSSLLCLLLYGVAARGVTEELSTCGLLNLTGFLFGTVGGLGTVFAMVVSPQIRAGNRISVFIAFFSAAFVAIAWQSVADRLSAGSWRRRAWIGGLVVLTAVGCWEQIPEVHFDDGLATAARDDAFFESLTARVPAGFAMFQLPYHPFPEGGSRPGFEDYAHVKGFVYAPQLRWSMPVMRGRDGDLWHRYISAVPPQRLVSEVRAAGFDGMYFDKAALGGEDEAVLDYVRERFGPAIIDEGPRGRCVFAFGAEPAASPTATPSVRSVFHACPPPSLPGAKTTPGSVDALQGTPLRNGTVQVRAGHCVLAEGWSLDGDNRGSQQVAMFLENGGKWWSAEGFTGAGRPDVSTARAGADKHCGFLIYASTENLEPGEYSMFLATGSAENRCLSRLPARMVVR